MAQVAQLGRSISQAGRNVGERAGSVFRVARAANIFGFVAVGVAGLAIGFLAGLLTAPASGSETRTRMRERMSRAAQEAEEAMRPAVGE